VTDIVEFLRARLDEDEAAAAEPLDDWPSGLAATQLANRFDPARVLREVEAKRRIVEIHTDSHECTSAEDNCVWISGEGDHCETLRLLALPYCDHSDYQPEWKPS
jgi:hypothetical protein